MSYAAVKRVAVRTALGDWAATWGGLLAGRTAWSSTTSLTGFDSIPIEVGALSNLDRALLHSGEGSAQRLARDVLSDFEMDHTTALYVGSNHGEAELVRTLLGHPTRCQGLAMLDDQMAPRLTGRAFRAYAACAAGLHALVAATHDLAEPDSPQRALVLAVDSLSVIETLGFARTGALSARGARPFAGERDGLTIGEGAVLVELDSSPAEHSTRILGIGMSCDAYHPTDPDPSGHPLERAIRMALTDAALEPADIGAIVAHGTGTPKGDLAEAAAFVRVWGHRPPPTTSVKGNVGHVMGAAGLLNFAVAYEIFASGVIPPTASAAGDRPLGDWVVTNKPKAAVTGAPVVCLASGFGGNNVAVVVGRS